MSVVLQGIVRQGQLILDVDIAVGNEVVAITGVNAIGKTTLLRLLAGLISLESGTLTVDGKLLESKADKLFIPAHQRSVGMVFQDPALLPFLNIRDNVAYPIMATGASRTVGRERALSAINDHGIEHLALMMPAQLSGGQQQRVALVRALVCQPRLVLLDEPLSALDVDARRDVRAWLRAKLVDLPGSKFVVTHDRQDIADLCDREIALVREINHAQSTDVQTTIIR